LSQVSFGILLAVSQVSLTYFTTVKENDTDNFDNCLDPENHKHASYTKEK